MASELTMETLVELQTDPSRTWQDGDERCHCSHCRYCGQMYPTYAGFHKHEEWCLKRRDALPALLAMAKAHLELVSALEFLDRGDGNRGTHGSDMRAPALLEMARKLGWQSPTATKEAANG